MDRNGFTDGEEALIEKIALAAVDRMAGPVCDKMKQAIKLHAAMCPGPQEMAKWKAKAAGFVLGIAAAGFIAGWAVTKVLAHVFGP